ncbi:MAG: CRISPR-associated endoribonuclease Cas6 [Calditrichaeota bacterium]|nr:CRISPR-associated endoribonuclease Cas6 [Calditrichota bacterium]
MRIKITFKNPKEKTYLPINTNYYLVKLIKHLTFEYRRYLSSLVPEHRYHKGFDVYTFSQLIIPERKIEDFMIGILSQDFHWYVASPYYQFLGILAKELKKHKKVKIYDTWFEVETVKFVQVPEFTGNEAQFTCLSPVTVLRNGSKTQSSFKKYVLPDHKDFHQSLERDLKHKYHIINKKEIEKIDFDLEFDPEYLRKKNNRITKVITIERESRNQEQVRCILAPFKIKAKPEVLKVIYDAGIGQLNSLGFGMVEMVNHDNDSNKYKK